MTGTLVAGRRSRAPRGTPAGDPDPTGGPVPGVPASPWPPNVLPARHDQPATPRPAGSPGGEGHHEWKARR